jgi:methyltransferase (TIGR00027 family)
MSDTPSKPSFTVTARWIAAARARESRRDDRLFDDPYAELFASSVGWRMLEQSEQAAGSENRFLPVRTRFFDDALLAAARDHGQVVLLGAGFDVRAYRLSLPSTTHVFELDAAVLLVEKEHVLDDAGAQPQCPRTAVPAELKGDWITPLVAAGFDTLRRTVWLAEGLFFYLDPADVETLVRRARELSAEGSLFLADMFGSGLLTQPAMQPYLRHLEQNGRPLPFCTDDPRALFTGHGWDSVTITYPSAPEANYGRFQPRSEKKTEGADAGRAYLVQAVVGATEPASVAR